MNEFPVVEDQLILKTLFDDIDIVKGNIIEERARRSLQKYKNTVRLLRYKNQNCFKSNINANMTTFRCSQFDTFLRRTFNF